MAMVDVDGISLPTDSHAKSVGLVWGLAAIWRSVCIHQMNLVNSLNSLAMMTAPQKLPLVLVLLLHFAWVVDNAKCIVVTASVSVCVSVRGRMPTLLHGPGCNLKEW